MIGRRTRIPILKNVRHHMCKRGVILVIASYETDERTSRISRSQQLDDRGKEALRRIWGALRGGGIKLLRVIPTDLRPASSKVSLCGAPLLKYFSRKVQESP